MSSESASASTLQLIPYITERRVKCDVDKVREKLVNYAGIETDFMI